MAKYVLSFQEIDRAKSMVVGGKGANLGELSRIKGIQVPDGFCVTTQAYKKITENNQEFKGLLDELMRLTEGKSTANESGIRRSDTRRSDIYQSDIHRSDIHRISEKIRMVIERTPISEDIAEDALTADIAIPNAMITSANVNSISPWSSKLSSLSVNSRYATRLKMREAAIIQALPRHE